MAVSGIKDPANPYFGVPLVELVAREPDQHVEARSWLWRGPASIGLVDNQPEFVVPGACRSVEVNVWQTDMTNM